VPTDPLILTLRLDPGTFARLDALRQAYFPPERNLVPAHVTLFHALPGEEEVAVRDHLAAVAAETAAFQVRFPKVHLMGKGVALVVGAPELVRLRNRLARQWADWLTPQDRHGYRPHCTVQNKVSAAEARGLFDGLTATWEPFAGRADGLRPGCGRSAHSRAARRTRSRVSQPASPQTATKPPSIGRPVSINEVVTLPAPEDQNRCRPRHYPGGR
jgi:2'-5' RNA ligase